MSNFILSAIADLQRNNYEVDVVDMHKLIVTFHGPADSYYRDGIWKVGIKLPQNFPNSPPIIVRFLNKIFHPNIDLETGKVCLDVLGRAWNRESSLYQIFEYYLPQLLSCPCAIDPFNVEAANMYLGCLDQFEVVAIEWRKTYALQRHLRGVDFEQLFDD